MGKTLDIYNRLRKIPGGKKLFARILTFRVPYFSTIHPRIQELRAGYCQVEIKDRRSIHNHLKSVNAGALCTLGELTGGLAVEASLPENLRWIPKNMTVEYVKKAKGLLVSTCTFDPAILTPGDSALQIQVRNPAEELVFRATIDFYISRRPDKSMGKENAS